MKMIKRSQFQLYLLTLHFLGIINLLLLKSCNYRCVYSTIINRAYYSSYNYCLLWLRKKHKFKLKRIWEFKNKKDVVGEHTQVRNALCNYGEKNIETELEDLSHLRTKADYYLNKKLTRNDVDNAIDSMKTIFNHLQID